MDAVLTVLIAVLGGAIRVGTPFLFVSLGECITEKAGRINLGLEGVLVFSAMAGFGAAYGTGLWWVGVLAAGASGALIDSAAATAPESDQPPSGMAGICGACGWISGLPR